MAKKAGRPTKYNENRIKELDDYLARAIPENMDLPTVEGFALEIGVNKTTVYLWAKKHKLFSNALKRLEATQKQHLVRIGIFGGKEINSNIVSLMLKVNHKMIETERKELTGKDGDPLVLEWKGDKD